MKPHLIRLAISALTGFNALSAIGGGTALLLGTYQDGILVEAGGEARFPVEWLRDTPFGDYTVPALILMVGVGEVRSSLSSCSGPLVRWGLSHQ